MPDYDVLVLGEINVDLILSGGARPAFGQAEKVIDDAALTPGGSGVIFACGCARLGLRTAYCGVVGDDLFGRFMLDSLRQRGVDPCGVQVRADQKTGLSVILNDTQDGAYDRAILTHLGAINALRAEMVDRALLAHTRHVHVTSYFLQHLLQPGLAELLDEARRNGATVSMDTNWDPTSSGITAWLRRWRRRTSFCPMSRKRSPSRPGPNWNRPSTRWLHRSQLSP